MFVRYFSYMKFKPRWRIPDSLAMLGGTPESLLN